ncbi:MAG: lipocalin-like domain-containing protein [Pseudomonadota bacterium]
MRRWLTGLLLAIALLSAVWYAEWALREKPAAVSVGSVLGGGDTAGYARVLGPREFSFPADHGPHPDYRQEWWYYTGNLTGEDGRHFGFQLTFFRFALTPKPRPGDSAWSTNQIYMAHFALTDVAARRFYHAERFSRNALGLAGAQAMPFRVWLEDWSVTGDPNATWPLQLRAVDGDLVLDLRLTNLKPPLLQGERGYSRKGQSEGNASYYYSLTRMPAEGTLKIADETLQVSGAAWMDREWSTSVLEEGQAGWDWFALQLADGRDLMFYRLRRRDGSLDPHSSGVIVAADGTSRSLPSDAIGFEVLDHWRSPATGTRYPARWRVTIPSEQLRLEIAPRLAEQELDGSLRYWEGTVKVSGQSAQQAITGHGYVELVGYGDQR